MTMHWCWCLECDKNLSVVSIIVDKDGLTTYVLSCGHRRKIN